MFKICHLSKIAIRKVVKCFYKKAPFPQSLKIKVKEFVFRHFTFLVRNTRAYNSWLNTRTETAFPLQQEDLNELISEANEAVDLTSEIYFPLVTPTVSVIIPVYNKLDYTIRCLKSLCNQQSRYTFEVIVVDDCSTDSTEHTLSSIPNLVYLRNEINSGFIYSCNKGAKHSRGEFLLFLNNDTVVLPGWLDELVQTFSDQDKVGLVGSKLLYPDGQLQEAGGIIWRDATGWNYGRLSDPNRPEYCYLREVDYCSGASIMVPAKIFWQVGGFDSRYVPAYFEDSDLAFGIRALGYKVLYQPLSQLIHYEGITSGTDLTSGTKRYQEINRPKFYEKWQNALSAKSACGDVPLLLAREQQVKHRILMIDYRFPTPDKDAGSVTAYFFLRLFQSLGYKVTFYPNDRAYMGSYTQNLQRLGVECLYKPYTTSLTDYLKENGNFFDVIFVSRGEIASKYICSIKEHCQRAKILFDVTDLHFVRESRQAEIENDPYLKKRALKLKQQEFNIIQQSHYTIVHGHYEKQLLETELPQAKVMNIPFFSKIYGRTTKFSHRKDICFLGGFLHSPNVDAVKYFVKNIWSLVQSMLPDVCFYIVGSHPPEEIRELANENIIVTGHVPCLEEYFNRCRVSIAPLRYGAGVKGKIVSSLSYGVPCVASSVAAEGMGLSHEQNVMIADDTTTFAEAIVKLYTDELLWQRLSDGGLKIIEEEYSLETGKNRIIQILKELSLPYLNKEEQ